jgi:hypothetical protein
MSAGTRSTAALAVSILALVLAAAGVGYAATKISGKTIKVGSTPGNRLKDNTLTGRQVDESTFAEVPSAARAALADHAASAVSADRAASAANADHAASADRIGSLTESEIERAGRVLTFDVRMGNTDPPRTLFQAGPFTVQATCGVSSGQNIFHVNATTSENDSAARAFDIFDAEQGDTDFDVGDVFKITENQDGSTNSIGPYAMSAYLWSPGGTMVRLELAQGSHLFSNNASDQVQCTYSGFAIVS